MNNQNTSPTVYYNTTESVENIDNNLKTPTFLNDVSSLDSRLHQTITLNAFEPLRPHQKCMLTPGDKVICAPSGSGKTTGILLAILEAVYTSPNNKKVKVVVTANTKELLYNMDTLCRKFSERKIKTALMLGGPGSDVKDLKSMNYCPDVIFATVGRLYDILSGEMGERIKDRISKNQRFRRQFRNYKTMPDLSEVKMLILDEADSILTTSNDKTARQLDFLCNELSQSDKLCKHFVSATFTTDAIQKAASLCSKKTELYLLKDVASTMPNSLRNYFVYVGKDNRKWEFDARMRILLMMQELMKQRKMIVFTHTRHLAETICDTLYDEKIAFLSPWDKLDKFYSGKIKLLVAMDGVSRGIDFEGVSAVINFTLPAERETYVHRVGRAARRGLNGISLTCFADKEFHKIDSICNDYKIPLKDMEYHPDYIIDPRDRNLNDMCDWVGLSATAAFQEVPTAQDPPMKQEPSLQDTSMQEKPLMQQEPSSQEMSKVPATKQQTPKLAWANVVKPNIAKPNVAKSKVVDNSTTLETQAKQIELLMKQVQSLQAALQTQHD